MGRHSALYIAAQQRLSTAPATGSAVHVGRVGLLAVTLGIGAAIAGGTAVANADASTGNDHTGTTTTPATKAAGTKSAGTKTEAGPSTKPSRRQDRRADTSADSSDDSPASLPRSLSRRTVSTTKPVAVTVDTTPVAGSSPQADDASPKAPVVREVLKLVRQEFEAAADRRAQRLAAAATTAAEPVAPTPTDQVPTQYGSIGKWMLAPGGKISTYGGQLEDGKTLLEPVNVIIVDPKATNAFQATIRLNRAMRTSGFPAQAIHSGGFRGIINNKSYAQQPSGLLLGYSDNFFLETNNHGRIFGPAPVATTGGYVWSGAFSEEEWGTYNGRPAHLYVSSNVARTGLATKLVASGRATVAGYVALDNAYNTDTTTTGDHDGTAVVLVLT